MSENQGPYSVIEQWLEDLHQQGKSDHTLATYRQAVRRFVEWSELLYDQDFDPTTIIGRDVRDWKAHQQTVEKAAPATINQRLALSRFFAWAVRQGLAQEEPTHDIKSVRLPQRQPQGLSNWALVCEWVNCWRCR